MQLGIRGHAITDGARSAYSWCVFDFGGAGEAGGDILNSGCGRDKRDPVTGAWVAVGRAASWIADSECRPRSVLVVARPEVTKYDPVHHLHEMMRDRVAELIASIGAIVLWDVATPRDQREMVAECQHDVAMMRHAEKGKTHGENRG